MISMLMKVVSVLVRCVRGFIVNTFSRLVVDTVVE